MKTLKYLGIWNNLFSFYLEKPTAIRVYPCPSCNETISADAPKCRFCGLPIDAATAEPLLLINQRVTNAVASANTYRLSVLFAVVVLLDGIMTVLMQRSEPSSLFPVLGIGYGIYWLYKYRLLITKDGDYPVAVRKVKLTIVVWLLSLLLPWAIAKYELWKPDKAFTHSKELSHYEPQSNWFSASKVPDYCPPCSDFISVRSTSYQL